MNSWYRITAVFLLVLAGCAANSKVMRIEDVAAVIGFGDQYFLTLSGKPLAEDVVPVENAHVAGQMDEWRSAKYEGVLVRYYRVVSEGQNILSRLMLTTDTVQLPLGLRVGSSRSAVLRALGKPTSSERDVLVYTREESYVQAVSFKMSDDVVESITWDYELD
jgi:hypothetical protein